jgi:proteasome lid subunit RPN8/RPN11
MELTTGTAIAQKFAVWSVPDRPLRIEYSEAVLDEIRLIAVEGYHRVPHGGVETGGILFGTHEKNAVRIKAWRPIECEYAKGPSFLLSQKDEVVLAQALKSTGGDAELKGLEPVGWYRAHTRSEILLADVDLAFFNRFFPQPWQIGLIVRPASFAPTRAGFFFREANGEIRTAASYREFTLTPLAQGRALVAEPVAEVSEAPPQTESPPVPVVEFTPYQSPRRFSVRPRWYVAGLSALALAVAVFWLLKPTHPSLKLFARDTDGELMIVWDGAARAIRDAKGGSIDIDDHGVRTQVRLSPADLRSGNLYYARLSGDVAVRLRVDVPGSQPVEETARFLRPGLSAAVPPPGVGGARQPESPRPADATQAPAGQVPHGPETPAVSARLIVPFRAPNKAPRQMTADMPAIAPPRIDAVPPALPAGLASVLGPASAPPPAPVASVAPPRPAIAAPVASGRIIWTGRLAKSGRLVVERNHASSGAISGALPAIAARVSAYPGDLTADGITLFTADLRYVQPLTETAGAENGWNPTTYTWDPKRAAGIKVLQQPGPQNGYKLVLESDMPKLSVVLLEWHAVQ